MSISQLDSTRAKITDDVQDVISRHGLRLRGSWLHGDQHFVGVGSKIFSLSDIDIVTDDDLPTSVEKRLRAEIDGLVNDVLLLPLTVSIRNSAVNKSASQVTNHNTVFWVYIALLELKLALLRPPIAYCDAESYFLNKFLLTIWRNILLDSGKTPTSYSSILNTLDGVSTKDKKCLLSIKKGESSSGSARSLVSDFHQYTDTWVEANCKPSLIKDLQDVLAAEAYRKDFSLIFGRLKQTAISETEHEVITYSQTKVGLELRV